MISLNIQDRDNVVDLDGLTAGPEPSDHAVNLHHDGKFTLHHLADEDRSPREHALAHSNRVGTHAADDLCLDFKLGH